MKKYLPWALCLAFLGFALYFFSLLMDAGISLDGARTRSDRLQERSELSLEFVSRTLVGESRASILKMSADAQKRGVIVKNYPTVIEVGDMVFEVSNDRVTKIRYMD